MFIIILYHTLEGISYDILYQSFMQAFVGFPITEEATYGSFCEMLQENGYDPSISIGAFEESQQELVGFVLNRLKADGSNVCAYDILTGTKPMYRRRGIADGMFQKAIPLLKQTGAAMYKTEVLKSNIAAIALYKAQGFTIGKEITSVLSTTAGSRDINQYELVLYFALQDTLLLHNKHLLKYPDES